jgi:uncharacterized protein YndB with AHSA1/START domain
MGAFAITITIDKPPEAVFAFLADPAKLPLWLEAVDDVAFADTPPRRGARFQMARSLPGGRVVNEVEFVKFDPGRRVALESRTGATPFRYEYVLDPTGRGTRVRLVGRISAEDLPGPVARLDGIATQLFRRGMQRNLRTLEHLLATGVAAHQRTCRRASAGNAGRSTAR